MPAFGGLVSGVLLGALVSMLGPDAVSATQANQLREPIRLLSTSHEIDFPDRVLFSLEAEAEAEIVEIRLFYRLGGRSTRIYGYPTFTPSNRVTAEFAVRTSGASFVPSGADIEYFYEIRDAVGNNIESERFVLEYKDPAFDWQRFQREELVILWHDRPRSQVVEVARDVGERLVAVKELLGLENPRPMKAVILNSSREAGRSFPPVSDTTSRRHVFGGFAFGDLDLFVLAGLDRDSVIHEMVHLLLDEALDSPLARVPSWLNEGLAMHFESESRGRQAAVAQAARNDRLLRLRSMGSVPGVPADVRLFYAQASSVVNYVMDAHGPEMMAALLETLNKGRGIEAAVREVYGLSLEGLERAWKADLLGEPRLFQVTDPGTLGTSAIIGGAVAIAVVMVVIRWLRHLGSPPDPA